MISCLLFDLDGTLTDPSLGITNSIMYALGKMGREIPERESLYCFIGPPLVPAFQSFLGMSEDESQIALKYYREYFSVDGKFENSPYAGIGEALRELKESGKTLALATSKPEIFATQILEHFDLAKYFTVICGATLDKTRNEKSDIIRYALDCLEASPCETIMIGDRFHDIVGAKDNGISSLGVLWGFGSKEELDSYGVDATVATIPQMVEYLKKI